MPDNPDVRYLYAGDCGLTVEFGNQISPELHLKVTRLLSALDQKPIPGILDLIPAYRSLHIQYDPLIIPPELLIQQIRAVQTSAQEIKSSVPRTVKVPVVYGGQAGPDLESLAEHHHLTAQEVIRIHSEADYLVYMIGFTPGFAYLGGMPERIATPRLKTPRLNVPAGSVGIAGAQTGIYPVQSPSGWHIIGRTALKLFNPADNPPSLLRPGDRVRFIPAPE
ncbi:MAG: 5-oxoprolinase subunit PxpB [Planctomycetota bacterium]